MQKPGIFEITVQVGQAHNTFEVWAHTLTGALLAAYAWLHHMGAQQAFLQAIQKALRVSRKCPENTGFLDLLGEVLA